MAERLGTGLQNLLRRFEPVHDLKNKDRSYGKQSGMCVATSLSSCFWLKARGFHRGLCFVNMIKNSNLSPY